MAQFFQKSANDIARVTMVLGVVLAGVAFFAYTQLSRSSYITGQYVDLQQPVQFSHRHHVGDDGIDCRYCHSTVETTASAGMPSTQTCMNCHSEIWADSPYLEPVRASYRENKPIEWERVHDLPEYAYFNHSIHVAKGVGCSTCHGEVDNKRPRIRKTLIKWNGAFLATKSRKNIFGRDQRSITCNGRTAI